MIRAANAWALRALRPLRALHAAPAEGGGRLRGAALPVEPVRDLLGGGVLQQAELGADDAQARVLALGECSRAVRAQNRDGLKAPRRVRGPLHVGRPHGHYSSFLT